MLQSAPTALFMHWPLEIRRNRSRETPLTFLQRVQRLPNSCVSLRLRRVGSSDWPVVVVSTPDAIAFTRTPQEVLRIVYLTDQAGVSKGGFYPNGMNGAIKST